MPAPLGTFTDYASFVALLRARKAELGLSDLVLDDLAGLAGGHSQKVLGPAMVKTIGGLTFTALLDALGLSGTLYADPAKAAHLAADRRREARVRATQPVGRAAIARARPAVMTELSRQANKVRWKGATPEQRRAVGQFLAEQRRRKAMSRDIGESVSSA